MNRAAQAAAAELLARARRLPTDFGQALFVDIVRWDAGKLDAAPAAASNENGAPRAAIAVFTMS